MSRRDPSGSRSQHPMHPPSTPLPNDPPLSLPYPSYYQNYSQSQSQSHPNLSQHLPLSTNYSSPSSQGSDTLDTPPIEHKQVYTHGGKRPSSSLSNDNGGKRQRQEEGSPVTDKEEIKTKSTRGSRSVTPRPESPFSSLNISQRVYRLSPFENEVPRCRIWRSLQALSDR